MKSALFISAALTVATVAQPHGRRHQHHNRALIYEADVVPAVDVVTATAPAVLVYVDSNGNAVSTNYNTAPAETQPPAPAKSNVQAAEDQSSQVVVSSAYAAGTPPASASTTAASSTVAAPVTSPSSTGASGAASSGFGITYTPYNDNGSCKSKAQVQADFQSISGYGTVRLYGTDCDQTANVLAAASAKGMKLFAGVYDITQVDSEINKIISAAKGNWTSFDTVAIGNEGVNSGQYTVDAVVAAIARARSLLQRAGYTGKVVTVDTFVAIIANPRLCQASDYAAANCHAFFDGGVTAAQAGDFTLAQAQRVSQACPGKDTVITEAGWPWKGASNNKAVPSVPNQATALASLRSKFATNKLFLFTAFDDMWKQSNSQTFFAEQFWGFVKNGA